MLIVLARSKPEEAVHLACKIADWVGFADSDDYATECLGQGPVACDDCSDRPAS
jgi:hypothetical protein